MKKLAVVWPWPAAICSGLLCTACFPPFDLTWLCWIALTPLIGAIWFSGEESRHRWLRNVALGYVAGLAFFWTALSWLTTVTVLGWIVIHGRVCERDRNYNGVAFDPRGAHSHDATAL